MLTDEQAAEITMMMRVANELQRNLTIIQDNAEIMASLSRLKEALGILLADLSDEERDELLERYKTDAESLGLYKGDA